MFVIYFLYQLGVLNVMSYLIERVGVAIRSICQDLVRLIILINPYTGLHFIIVLFIHVILASYIYRAPKVKANELLIAGSLFALTLGCLVGPQHATVLYSVNAGIHCTGKSNPNVMSNLLELEIMPINHRNKRLRLLGIKFLFQVFTIACSQSSYLLIGQRSKF